MAITKTFIENVSELHQYLFRIDGNACIVVSDLNIHNQYTVYDIDASEFFDVKYKDLLACEAIRKVEVADYQYRAIQCSKYADFVQGLVDALES